VRIRLKGINSITKRLADGTRRTYWYAWKGGPALRGEPGTPEFIASYNEAVAKKIAPPSGVLLALLFRFQESAEFQFGISPRTRRDYIKQIKRIERAFGDFPIKAMDDPRARSVFLEWRDKLAQTSLRQADYAYGTLARVLSWAHNRGLIAKNPCSKGGKLYHGTRASKIWHDEEVARFLRTAPPYLRLAMLLAINTAQRQGDLLRLPWSAYDGTTIKLRQKKSGAYVPVPVADALKDALDAAPRKSPIMLTSSEGKPWSESGFQGAWGKATKRAGIRGLTFHDLRGTAVVTLARAGCNEVEIYTITGHKPGDVQAILTTHYLPRDAEVAGNAIAKLNRYRSQRGDQKGDENLPTALPTALKIANVKMRKS
jgi:integrase